MTLPVTFDETVARRRAVMYPDALRIEFAAPAAPLRTAASAVLISMTGSRRVQ